MHPWFCGLSKVILHKFLVSGSAGDRNALSIQGILLACIFKVVQVRIFCTIPSPPQNFTHKPVILET